MKYPVFLFAVIFLLICSFDGAEKNELQQNLKLTLVHEPTESGKGNGALILNVVNTSSTETYTIIHPGDGSENAWREPFIFFSAEFKKKKSEAWEPLPYHKPLRCGIYDADWKKDTIIVKPNTTVEIYKNYWWMASFFTIPSDGDIRLTGHYKFDQGINAKGNKDTTLKMDYPIPRFALTSDTIQFAVKKKRQD
jgi:hypothetical protein